MSSKLPYQMRNRQIFALVCLGILLFSFQVFRYFKIPRNVSSEVLQIVQSPSSATVSPISTFDPNLYDFQDWKALGFTDKQVATILNYKHYLGGRFTSREQLKECYAISEEKYLNLEPFILLPQTSKEVGRGSGNPSNTYGNVDRRRLVISAKFNPNDLDAQGWERVGFTKKQAMSILKYKKYLGGQFINSKQLEACYVISESYFNQLKPYLVFPENQDFQPSRSTQEKTEVLSRYFDPNHLDKKGWQEMGFSEKQAQTILNYKNKVLRGAFKTEEDLRNCFVIGDKRLQQLKPWIRWSREEPIVFQTPEGEEQGLQKLEQNIELNSVTYAQLVELGFSSKIASGFLAFRKKLGGFADKSQVYEVYGIDRELAKALIDTSVLDDTHVIKYTLYDAPEGWLKTHPYFRYSAEKVIYYRLSITNEKKLWKQLSVKPEYERKMRWYLR